MKQHTLRFVTAMSLLMICLSAEAMTAPPDSSATMGLPALVVPNEFKDASQVEIAIAGREAGAEAFRLIRAGKHEESLAQFRLALYANPYQSSLWNGRGSALYALKRYGKAIESYKTALQLGGPGGRHYATMYNIVCCHALLDQKDKAFAMLEQAMKTEIGTDANLLRTDSDLDSLRDDPRWKKIVPIDAPEGLSRDEGWRYDLVVLERRIKDLYYDINAATSEAAIEAAIAELSSRVGDLTDDGIALEIQRVLAMLGDGHSSLRSWPRGENPLPLRFRLFSDGLFVESARGEYANVAGWRVISIGGKTVTEALASVEPFISRDNRMGIAFIGPRYLSRLALLRHVGLLADDDTVRIEFEDEAGGRHTRNVSGRSSKSAAGKSPWVSARDGTDTHLPRYLKNRTSAYWFEHLPEHDLVYFQFNGIRSDARDPIEEFMPRLFAYLEEHDVGHLIVDLRLNGGGNTYLNHHLMEGLIRAEKINHPDRLFVITGRNTFSAAMNLTTDIDIMTNATFVGEPAGSRPNFIGETRGLTLPVSGLRFTCSTRMHMHGMDSTDERMLIAPDYHVPLSSEDYRLNRDPVMATIIEIIKRKRNGDS